MNNSTRTKYLLTIAYCASFVAMGISMSSLGPTLQGLAELTRSSLSSIAILFTARSLGSFVGSVGGGQFYDYIKGHKLMAVVIIGMAGLTALTPVIPVLWLLALILFLTGAVQGMLNIGGNTLLVWVHDTKVGPYMNALHFCFGVGTFITPIIVAQFIVHEGGLYFSYLFLAVLILPAASIALLPSPEPPHRAQGGEKDVKLDVRLIVLISLVFGCYNGAALAFGGWIYTYAIEMNLATATTAAYLTSVFWGGLTLGRLAAIPLALRFSPRAILRADYAGALISLLVMLVWPHSNAAVIVTCAGLGFSLASIYPTTMSLSRQLMSISGKVTGLFAIGQSIGAMVIPWLIGLFFEPVGPQVLAVVLIADFFFALAVLVVLDRYQAKRTAAFE